MQYMVVFSFGIISSAHMAISLIWYKLAHKLSLWPYLAIYLFSLMHGMNIGRWGRGQNICIFVWVWSQIVSIPIWPWTTGRSQNASFPNFNHGDGANTRPNPNFTEAHLWTSYIFSGARDPHASRGRGIAGQLFTRAWDPYAQFIRF